LHRFWSINIQENNCIYSAILLLVWPRSFTDLTHLDQHLDHLLHDQLALCLRSASFHTQSRHRWTPACQPTPTHLIPPPRHHVLPPTNNNVRAGHAPLHLSSTRPTSQARRLRTRHILGFPRSLNHQGRHHLVRLRLAIRLRQQEHPRPGRHLARLCHMDTAAKRRCLA